MKESIPKQERPRKMERKISVLLQFMAGAAISFNVSECNLPEVNIPENERVGGEQLNLEEFHKRTEPKGVRVGSKTQYNIEENKIDKDQLIDDGVVTPEKYPELWSDYRTILKKSEGALRTLGYSKEEINRFRKNLESLSFSIRGYVLHYHPALFGLYHSIEGGYYLEHNEYPDNEQKLRRTIEYVEAFIKFSEKKGSSKEQNIVFNDCEDFGVKSETMEQVVGQTWPEICRENIQAVQYKDEAGVSSYTPSRKAYADCTRKFEASEVITVYDPAKGYPPSETVRVLDHEAAHAIDFVARESMRLIDRLQMVRELYDRLQSEDRFRSVYVETIFQVNKDRETLYKIDEYWAEIYCEFIKDPTNFEKEYPKDYFLIKKYVLDVNPDFDPINAVSTRKELLKAADHRFIKQKIEQISNQMKQEFSVKEVATRYVKIIITTLKISYEESSPYSTDVTERQDDWRRSLELWLKSFSIAGAYEEQNVLSEELNQWRNKIMRLYMIYPDVAGSLVTPADEEELLKEFKAVVNK